MIKGAQKRMIVVKTNDSRVFEEAYFVVRKEAESERMDMLAEANKIIESCGGDSKKKEDSTMKRRLGGALIFVAGILAGGGVGTLITLLVG